MPTGSVTAFVQIELQAKIFAWNPSKSVRKGSEIYDKLILERPGTILWCSWRQGWSEERSSGNKYVFCTCSHKCVVPKYAFWNSRKSTMAVKSTSRCTIGTSTLSECSPGAILENDQINWKLYRKMKVSHCLKQLKVWSCRLQTCFCTFLRILKS